MPAPDPTVAERQYYLSILGWSSDNPNLTMEDLRQRVLEAKTIGALDKNIRFEDPTKPLVSSLQSAGIGGTVTATDNGDGGVTLATSPSSKFPKFVYAEGAYLKVANAVPLATSNPQPPGIPTAGTAGTASRGDHVHALPPSKPFIVAASSGSLSGKTIPMAIPGNPMNVSTANRCHFVPTYVRTPDRTPLSITALAINITTAGGAGATIRFGLYGSNSDGSINIANKLFDSGEVPCTTTGFKTAAWVTTLVEGVYWFAVVAHVSTTTQWTQGDHGMYIPDNFNQGQLFQYGIINSIAGALPTTGSLATGGDGSPCAWFVVA